MGGTRFLRSVLLRGCSDRCTGDEDSAGEAVGIDEDVAGVERRIWKWLDVEREVLV